MKKLLILFCSIWLMCSFISLQAQESPVVPQDGVGGVGALVGGGVGLLLGVGSRHVHSMGLPVGCNKI